MTDDGVLCPIVKLWYLLFLRAKDKIKEKKGQTDHTLFGEPAQDAEPRSYIPQPPTVFSARNNPIFWRYPFSAEVNTRNGR